MAIGDLFGSIGIGGGTGGGGFLSTAIWMIFGAVILILCGFGLWLFLTKKKRWNVQVEFKIPRNVRKVRTREQLIKVIGTLNKEWGKGHYNAKQGVVYIKRKGKKAVPMKPFDVKQYLSTGNILTVIQTGIEDYRPVKDESYIELETIDSEGNRERDALVQAIIDTSESKSWKNSFEREAKNTYSIKNWIAEHGALIAMGIVLMMNLVGFAIVISRMPK